MTARAILERARSEQFTWVDYYAGDTPFDATAEHGDEEIIELFPPLSEPEIEAFAGSLPAPLPTEIRDLLSLTSGFNIGATEVRFTSYNDWGCSFLLPHVIVLAGDGGGNLWVIEISPETAEWRNVWFACHDPPVLVYQCATLSEFIEGVFDLSRFEKCKQGHRSILYRIDKFCEEVWRSRRRLPTAESLRGSNDPLLRNFANELPDRAMVADLRRAKLGDGFDWSPLNSGPRPVRRASCEMLFGVEPKRGILARLFTRP